MLDIALNWLWGAIVTIVAVSSAGAMGFGITAYLRGWRGEVAEGTKFSQKKFVALLSVFIAGCALLLQGMINVGANPFGGGEDALYDPPYRPD